MLRREFEVFGPVTSVKIQVETVQKEMTLDMSCVDFDIDAVKATLAAQYGVDVALISTLLPCPNDRSRVIL